MARAPNETREKLIKTARELIWRNSYNAVSVDEICASVDVKKGSFYHFFPSKAHLALETMEACTSEMKNKYDDIFSPTRPPLARFEMVVDFLITQQKEAFAELGHVCGCPFMTLGSELAAQDPAIGQKVSEIFKKKISYYESALHDLIRRDEIPNTTDVSLKAEEIFAFIVGQLMTARIKNDLGFIEKEMKRALFDLIGVSKNKNSDLID